jgi:hypothetical protein
VSALIESCTRRSEYAAAAFDVDPERACAVFDYGAYLVVVPWADAERPQQMPSVARAHYLAYSVSEPLATAELSLGELAVWCQRRGRDQDSQLILGVPYDRRHVADALTWPLRQRTPASARVSLALKRSPDARHEPTESILQLRCGSWTAYVMCLRGEHVGDDPLFPEAKP